MRAAAGSLAVPADPNLAASADTDCGATDVSERAASRHLLRCGSYQPRRENGQPVESCDLPWHVVRFVLWWLGSTSETMLQVGGRDDEHVDVDGPVTVMIA